MERRLVGRPEWWAADAQVVVMDLDEPQLNDDDLHHLGRVLRLRAGSTICVTDGAGGWRMCEFSGTVAPEPLGPVRQEPPARYPVAVGFALVKGDRPELVVQKLTEVGVDRVVVFAARRSVVRWDEARAAKHLTRLRRVAREACGQCRRLWLPELTVADLVSLRGTGVVCAEAEGRPLSEDDRMVLIGPEGGWDPGEVGEVEAVCLGRNVLRAETAAIVAGHLLTSVRDGVAATRSDGPGGH
jgi:16S rRNA (uracil1498-N3)-methyltransferase